MASSESTEWQNTRLSLEKPYKDANGTVLKKLVEISNDEEFIYEQPKSVDEQLGTRLQRVFEERGNAIWDEYDPQWAEGTGAAAAPEVASSESNEEDEDEDDEEQQEVKKKPMNVEELAKLRAEVVPTLMQALNELMISRDVLGVYLRTAIPNSAPEGITPELVALPPKAIASTTTTKPPPLPSMQAFNAQLAVGGKDEAIRKSAAAFKTASISMRRALASGERYWTDALKARQENWALSAAPHLFGAMTRRAADNHAMDICISYGLEHSVPNHRLNSIAYLNVEDGKGPIAPEHRKHMRLCVFITITSPDGTPTTSRSTYVPSETAPEDERVEDVLQELQREAIDREIYAELVGNVGSLTTAPAWVREGTVSVDISSSPEVVLKFALLPESELEASPLEGSDTATNALCDAIYHALRLILLRVHAFNWEYRNAFMRPSLLPPRPVLLQGVVELFQYYLFVQKLEGHLGRLVNGLQKAGVEVLLRFNRLGSTAEELIGLLATSYSSDEGRKRNIGGEVILHIAKRHTLRFTLTAPSIVKAYLAQSTSDVHSMAQLDELLKHEVNRAVLQRICDLGREKTPGYGAEAWSIDVVAATCSGSWDGNTIHFKLSHAEGWALRCRVDVSPKGQPVVHKRFSAESGSESIFDWATSRIQGIVGG
ncbi:hypothetical protein M408DRAFT_331134 [Serendipita vermifera MAFF 305830]|uniref:Mediator of RNA polymerase II transcription subunit 17 n=1 Tax=Serendipita vermifera MAFF 305830 TaxID=933852 RepID=A0A0C3B278_SERVB|nr:hypothetical protein M408DRAFT_331134 [Serendipita vermifera MAFF 305830]